MNAFWCSKGFPLIACINSIGRTLARRSRWKQQEEDIFPARKGNRGSPSGRDKGPQHCRHRRWGKDKKLRTGVRGRLGQFPQDFCSQGLNRENRQVKRSPQGRKSCQAHPMATWRERKEKKKSETQQKKKKL